MALFSKRNLKHNSYGLTKDDLKGDIEGFPMGVVVRMLEEQEAQGNKPDVKVFQEDCTIIYKGFVWSATEASNYFWGKVLNEHDYNLFFERYPEYKRYNLN